MTLLTLNAVERSHGDLTVFEGVSLRLGEGERVGVVGDNGSGKTTLVRVLVGLDPPDRGERTTRRDLRIAYSEQIPDLPAGATVLEAAHAAFGELEALEGELRELEGEMAGHPDDRRLLRRYEDCLAAFEAGGGWDRERFAERTLTGLGFSRAQLDQDVSTLSGGQKARVALARVLLRPADLLVLDEPTNHLDLDGIAFLEDLLGRRRAAYVVVSHDRHFLDALVTSVVEVEGGRVTRYRGAYRDYRRQKQAELDRALDEFKKQQDFVAREMEFIRRHMGSRRTAEARGRLKRLRRLELLARPPAERHVRLSLGVAEARGLRGQTSSRGTTSATPSPAPGPCSAGSGSGCSSATASPSSAATASARARCCA
ncbi:MAG: ATP-binding cassette domain-containing protein [Planctomycetota bacterium]